MIRPGCTTARRCAGPCAPPTPGPCRAAARRLPAQLGREPGGTDLSEGQWQRTALARASMREDTLLLALAEPTASLDAPSEEAVFERYMDRSRRYAPTPRRSDP
ncbi:MULTISPECIES: hypothetical protein [unclassified Nocardiopsis]|uniref:hypothetical protein n=1 Tax=unclassified Nocardiopsis TaxID=2649073 RepID=UPI001359E10B|nr:MULTISPECIES: hypothetical protein [unclassified Nocardiopsis]